MTHEYPKIPGPYRRHIEGPNRNQLIEGYWTSPELQATATLEWCWTEKVDGTNVRVMWDGHRVTFGGRTDRAQMPVKLMERLAELFPEELLEQYSGADPVTLYGEGYGAGIQRGGLYRDHIDFVLFDVRVGRWWLNRSDVEGVAGALGIDCVPLVHSGPIQEAIDIVSDGLQSAWNPALRAEGLVGVTRCGLLARSGERLIVKVKACDFPIRAVPYYGTLVIAA
jgi:hypothetical protein